MIYHNAVKRILTAPQGSDRRSRDRLSLLLRFLNISLKGITLIEVMGESGKSACATMLSHALTADGYRTGTVTTPFSHSMTECITADGKPISMDDFTECVNRVCVATAEIRIALSSLPELSEEEKESLNETQRALYAYRTSTDLFEPFSDELLLAAASCHFTKIGCQVAVIEVPSGTRGGAYRLPISPLVSVITSTESVELAKEIGAHLDRKTHETVSALQEREVTRIISERCAAINCRLTYPLRNKLYLTELATNRLRAFYKDMEYTLNSGAPYQLQNLLTVLETLAALKRNGFSTDPAAATFQPLFGTAGVPLQFTAISVEPNVITDFADTPARRKELAQSLSYHKQILQSPITLIAPCSEESDSVLCQPFVEKDLKVTKVLRTDVSNPLRAMKPIIKELSPSDTLVILGHRSFVYEIHRTLMGLMP